MSVRTIEYTIDSGGRVTPSAPLYGGIQGEHNATSVVFDVSAILQSNAYYRVEWIDGAGEFGTSEHLTAQNGKITYTLTGEVTSGGIKITLTLIQAIVNENDVEQVILSVPVLIFLTAAGVDENTVAEYKRGLSGLALHAEKMASQSETAAQRAEDAADKAEEEVENHNTNTSAHQDIRKALSEHKTDTSSHRDIRDAIDTINNTAIPNVVQTEIKEHDQSDDAHADIREVIEKHKSDTTSHQDIRETINTLGSIHVPELIKSHNTDLEAHSDIRADIQTLGNTVIPNMAKSAAADAVNEHNYNATAHEDIRQQRNADMDNLSANIIPGIASAKVQAHNTDETAHSDIREKITALESDSVPEYWQVELDNGVEAIRKAAETAGRNKSAFLWYTDAHWNNNSQMSPVLLKYLYGHTPINKVAFGGDIVNNEPTAETIDDRTIMAYLWEWRGAVHGLNHHSVVGNHDDGNTTNNIFPDNYIYAYLLASEESNDIVYGDGFYYYIDDKCEKTRYLYLDTAHKGNSSNQLTFVKQALITTPTDWHIVVITHIWYQPDYDQYSVRPIPIKGLDANASNIIELLDNYNAREGDFTDCGGKVEFCIGGHTHIDYDGRTPGGIPIILTETDSKHIRSALTYTEGTITESSVNAIIADYDNNKICVIRIGRGESREVAIELEKESTNVLTTALDTDGVSVYNDIGYKQYARLSASGGYAESTASAQFLTGYIPAVANDVIYFKNVTMPYGNNGTHEAEIYLCDATSPFTVVSNYDAHKLPDTWSVICDENNNITQITVGSDYEGKYLRFNIAALDGTSIITVNEPIE